MSSSVIKGTPIAANKKVYVHARPKFTQLYAVDVIEKYNESNEIANNFLKLVEKNSFVKKVCEENGIVNGSSEPIIKKLSSFRILEDFDVTPVTVPTLILIFGLHTELCVTDNIEYIRQRFPHCQILVLTDLCKNMHNDYFLFNYCLRVKHADMADTKNIILINEDQSNENILE